MAAARIEPRSRARPQVHPHGAMLLDSIQYNTIQISFASYAIIFTIICYIIALVM